MRTRQYSAELSLALSRVSAAVGAVDDGGTQDAFKLVMEALEHGADIGDSHQHVDSTRRANYENDCRLLMERVARWYWDMTKAAPVVENGYERKLVLRGGCVGYHPDVTLLFEVRVKETIEEESF